MRAAHRQPAREPANVRAVTRGVLRYSRPMRGLANNEPWRAERWRAGLFGAAFALGVFAGGGCQSGASVLVDISVPRPLVEPLDARIGVYYEPPLTNYVHRESVDGNEYTIDIGASQAPVFAQVFDALFTGVVPMRRETPVGDGAPADGARQAAAEQDEQAAPSLPFHPIDADAGDVDGVLAPTIDEVQFATPKQTRSEFYEVWIRYRMRLFDTEGSMRSEWPLIGYGKASERNHGNQTESLNAAAIWALRDAAAVLAFEFQDNARLGVGGAGQKREGSP